MDDAFYNLMMIFMGAVTFAFAFTAAERMFGGVFAKRRKK